MINFLKQSWFELSILFSLSVVVFALLFLVSSKNVFYFVPEVAEGYIQYSPGFSKQETFFCTIQMSRSSKEERRKAYEECNRWYELH